MHLLMLLLMIGTTVQAESRISRSSFQAANFAESIQGRKLNGRVIEEPIVDSMTSCQFECMADDAMPVNFGSNSSGKGFKCELSDSDRFASVMNFTVAEGFNYGGLQNVCEAKRSLCGDKGVCIPNYQNDNAKCTPCIQESCVQLRRDGFTSSGVYSINPDGGEPMSVLCDMTTGGAGWTVFQRRLDGSVDFYNGWAYYKKGFGHLNGEFWLGNDKLHRLTTAYNVTMRLDLEDFEGSTRYAEYSTFRVANESDKYCVCIGGYNGRAGNSMTAADVYWRVEYSSRHCGKIVHPILSKR